MGFGCGSCRNVEKAGVREESCSVGWFSIIIVIVGRSEISSVGAASGIVVLLFVVSVSCVDVVVGSGGCVVVVIIVDDCCRSFCNFSFIHRRFCMLWMIWLLITARSADIVFSVVSVVVEERLQPDVVLGSGGGVETRGGVIIVVGADRCVARNRLIARCGKGKFSTSAATVR